MRKAANIYWLGVKELQSFLRDYVLLGHNTFGPNLYRDN